MANAVVVGAIVEATTNTIGIKEKGLGRMVCINTSRGRKPPVSFPIVSGDSTD